MSIAICRWLLDGQCQKAPGYGARFGSWLRNIETFDAPFFGISTPEAELMDAQQRILLELAWEILPVCNQISFSMPATFEKM